MGKNTRKRRNLLKEFDDITRELRMSGKDLSKIGFYAKDDKEVYYSIDKSGQEKSIHNSSSRSAGEVRTSSSGLRYN